MYDLCADPAITDRVVSLLGPDIVLWSSNFWTKQPGGKEVPWHQDINYWPLDPPLNVTAWLAIDEATVENSCVRIIPGSHKKMLPSQSHRFSVVCRSGVLGSRPSSMIEGTEVRLVAW